MLDALFEALSAKQDKMIELLTIIAENAGKAPAKRNTKKAVSKDTPAKTETPASGSLGGEVEETPPASIDDLLGDTPAEVTPATSDPQMTIQDIKDVLSGLLGTGDKAKEVSIRAVFESFKVGKLSELKEGDGRINPLYAAVKAL